MADMRNPLALFRPHKPTLTEQVASIGAEVADLANAVRHYAEPRAHDAADGAVKYAEALGHQLEPVAHDIARRARRVGAAVRRDPAPAIIGIMTLALVATLFARRQ